LFIDENSGNYTINISINLKGPNNKKAINTEENIAIIDSVVNQNDHDTVVEKTVCNIDHSSEIGN